jgi:hypothetical protein
MEHIFKTNVPTKETIRQRKLVMNQIKNYKYEKRQKERLNYKGIGWCCNGLKI